MDAMHDHFPVYEIKPKDPEDIEVRICVMGTKGLKMMDAEGTSDAFCKVFFDAERESKETDIHFRNQDGKASWNYRIILSTTHQKYT